jgi:hypothetical protein
MADDPSKANKKSLEIGVPDHGVDPGAAGSTFVHIGAFPDPNDDSSPPSFKKSLALARAAGRIGRLKTGGQWNHTDGNRITTTVGNVVDVIQGSYLGYRSSARSPPGPTLSCTWAEWSYSQVGSEDLPIGYTAPASATASATPPKAALDPTGGTATDVAVSYASVTSNLTAGSPVGTDAASEGDTGTDAGPVPRDGDVVSATWAQRVISYVGSKAQPVSYSFSYTYVYSSASYTNAPMPPGTDPLTWALSAAPSNNSDPPTLQQGDILAVTWARRVISYTGTSSQSVGIVFAETHAGSSTSNTYTSGPNSTYVDASGPNGTVTTNTVANAITTAQSAANITGVNTFLTQWSFNFGGLMTTLNAIAAQSTINLGAQLNITLPTRAQFTIDEEGFHATKSEADGTHTALVGAFNKVVGKVNEIQGAVTTVAGQNTQVSLTTALVAADVVLGI